MNIAVCPDDGTHLRAVQKRPLLLPRCPACDKRFELTGNGVTEVPADARPDN